MAKYSIFTIIAGMLWGCISIFIKFLTAAGFTSMQIMLIRALFSALMLFVFLLITNRSLLKIHLKDLWMFIGTGVISLTFFSFCYFTTIIESGASIAVILLYTSPIFVLALSIPLFKEKLTLPKLIALLMTFAGCIFVTGIGSSASHISLKGFLIGLCAGFGYALYSIFSRYALKKYASLTVTFYTFVFSGISLIPFCSIGKIPSIISSSASPVKLILVMCGIALFCTVLPYIFYTYGLTGLETGKAAIYVTVEPLVGTLIGICLFHEEFTILKILGILLILAAVILLGAGSTKKETQLKYSLAIFDMDGTILDTLEDLTDSVNVICRKYGYPEHTVEEVRFMVGNGIPKLMQRALPSDIEKEKFDVYLKEFIDYYAKHAAIKTRPYDGVVELIKKLKKAGVRIAVNTNKVEDAAVELCSNYFPGLFDIISGSRPGIPPKPAPDGIFEILKRDGRSVEEGKNTACFIGDSDVDMQTGMNAGLDVIGVDWGFRGEKFLKEHGAPVVVMNCEELYNQIIQK